MGGRPLEPERTAAMVLRIWVEGPVPGRVRARIVAAPGAAAETDPRVIDGTPDDVGVAVARWIEELLGPGSAPPPDEPVTRP